ncbi:MAG: hypothetical protein ACLP4R_29785, partial [Solirubrobacteraceae bacterium]
RSLTPRDRPRYSATCYIGDPARVATMRESARRRLRGRRSARRGEVAVPTEAIVSAAPTA